MDRPYNLEYPHAPVHTRASVVPCGILAMLFAGAAFSSGFHEFGTRGTAALCVPTSDMDGNLLAYNDESLELHSGAGRTPGFGFLFGPDEIGKYVQGFLTQKTFNSDSYANNLSGAIGFLGDDDRQRLGPAMRARDIADIWYAKGRCSNPEVTKIGETNLYQIKCQSSDDYASIWSRAPDPKTAMPDSNEFIDFTCAFQTLRLGPYAGNTRKNCSRVTVMDTYLVDYRIQEENVGLMSELDGMIRRKLTAWKRNCGGTAEDATTSNSSEG